MAQAAVFVDGAYLARILKDLGEPRIDFALLTRWAAEGYDLFRTYYYDCLPYQSPNPSDEERRRVSAKQRFFTGLKRLDRFVIRLGRLAHRGSDGAGNPVFEQKQVDLQIGLDLATLIAKDRVDLVALLTGDSDLLPAVKRAREEGILVRLVHGPKSTYHRDLWSEADEPREIATEIVSRMRLV
ncbi:MAG: NYN domain-containing protein [Candidatus Methylomirabilis sp.]